MNDELKKELGIDVNEKLPVDYNIPFYVHEEDLNKLDMSHKRVEKFLFILCMVLLISLIGSNVAWIHYENSFVDEVTVSQETPNGNNNYIGRDGDINNGETDNH